MTQDMMTFKTVEYILTMEDITDMTEVARLANNRLAYLKKRRALREELKQLIKDAKENGMDVIDDRTGEVMTDNLIIS